MAKMGRPPIGGAKLFTFLVSRKIIRRIKRLTHNISKFARQALEEKLDRDEKR